MPVDYDPVADTSTYPAPVAPGRVIYADFDGDGDADALFQTNGNGTSFSYATNNGNGTFTIVAQGGSPFSAVGTIPDFTGTNMFAADFDGDGDTDLWVQNTYYQNNGGSFAVATPTGLPAPLAAGRKLVGDFDADGDADILYQVGADGTLFRYASSNGDGTFTDVALGSSPFAGLSLPNHNGNNFYVFDLEGDGDLDVFAGANGTAGSLYRQGSNGLFTSISTATLPVIAAAARYDFVDADGDGDIDVLAQTGANGSAFVYYAGVGDGTFTQVDLASSPFAGLTIPDHTGTNHFLNDVDGDGDIDLITAPTGGGTPTVAAAQGSPPVLVSTTPGDDATNVSTTANIVLTFDEAVTKGTGNILIVRVSDGAIIESIPVGSAQVSGATTTWTIDPSGALDGSVEYAVRIEPGAFVDGDGVVFAGVVDNITLSFTTAAAPVGGDAQDDAFTTTESAPIVAGDLLADNGSGADTTVADITEVNGNAITYGVQFALPSGALLTVYANGTFDYDPNGVFNSLVDGTAGAGNSTATETFTYTVDGGDVATVTITINGETDSGDIYVGGGAGDTITGGGTGNTINAGGGNDVVNGLGGGDVINGEAGDDILNGGDQADKLNGGDDNDLLSGDEGNDILNGGAGADDLVGGNGNDTLDGGVGADDMNGGDGSDVYFVDDAGDTITDSSGIDTVKSTSSYILGAGLEHLTLLGVSDLNGTGNASNNTINGNDGVNTLSGMDGADKLYGFGGKDVLNGGAGADVIDGGDSNDVVHGGADNDTALGGNGNDILNGDDGNDQLDGGVGADKLYGGAGIDQLTGGLGNDYMYGGDGVDTMNGNDGNDYLDGGAGPDKMYGGVGNDVYIVYEYNDFILENVGEGFDVVRSFASYVMGENLEALELQAGAGDIAGTGNNGVNTITGNEGVNVLDGRGGVDTIRGGDGNDVIFGGLGNDLLYGQAGWDIFAVRQESVSLMTLETDRIFDLNIAGGDRVDLSAIDADSTTMGNQAFQFATVLSTFSGVAGEATLTYDAATASTFLRLDVNGDKKADYSLRIDGDHTGTSGNIIAPGAFLDGSGGWIL